MRVTKYLAIIVGLIIFMSCSQKESPAYVDGDYTVVMTPEYSFYYTHHGGLVMRTHHSWGLKTTLLYNEKSIDFWFTPLKQDIYGRPPIDSTLSELELGIALYYDRSYEYLRTETLDSLDVCEHLELAKTAIAEHKAKLVADEVKRKVEENQSNKIRGWIDSFNCN